MVTDDPACPQLRAVAYETREGAAKQGRDYKAVSEHMLVLTNLAGPERSFRVPIIDDRRPEGNETSYVVLHVTTLEGEAGVCPSPWHFNKTVTGRVTILDDDGRGRRR